MSVNSLAAKLSIWRGVFGPVVTVPKPAACGRGLPLTRDARQAHRKSDGPLIVRVQLFEAQARVKRTRSMVCRIHFEVHPRNALRGEFVEQSLDEVAAVTLPLRLRKKVNVQVGGEPVELRDQH